ncbi:hypothetical protein Z946_204 [Sulfitobacter noctilucicola]|nr:hypothetical protein Z946_204 [Sulfitobacter noctilucicola]
MKPLGITQIPADWNLSGLLFAAGVEKQPVSRQRTCIEKRLK